MSQYQKLFEPWMIGKVRIRNRIISAPMERNYCNIDGSVTQQYIDNLTAKAKGGAGLIFVESTYVDPRGKGRHYQLGCYDDRLIPGLRRLAEAVHQHGAKISLELQFSGRQTSGKVTGMQPIAPSPVACWVSGGDLPREMTVTEIKEMIANFAKAAERSKRADFDLVELHGAHGYLIAQFLSGYANKRTDEYGGSFEKRMRFPLEVVAAVRKAVGTDFPIAYRLSGDEYIDGGLNLEEAVPFAKKLEEAGVDLIDVSAGLYETTYIISQPMDIALGCNVHLAEEIKRGVNIPVSVAGRINDPAFADDILAQGKADFISFARALHADPDFPRKAQEGRLEDICMCIGCMQGCIDILGTGAPIFCAINSAVGKEGPYAIKKAQQRKKVMVVGGGPGGMEAARVAALRGHEVALYEKEPVLGGQVRWAAKPLFRGEYEQVIRYLSNQLKKAGVQIKLGQAVDKALVYAQQPDAIVVATGATPFRAFIPGRDNPHVYTYLDILSGSVKPGKKVAVVGGQKIGCEVAEFIADKGSEVVLIDPTDTFCQDAGQKIRWLLMERLENESKIEMRLKTTVEKIADSSITVQKEGKIEQIDGIDMVVLCIGKVSTNELADALKADARVPEIYMVGDCIRPRKITEAIAEGADVAHRI
ncbi:MAG: FAD-dependent oxidoreductase [Desulfobacteraceae bacterium]|nr:MAG: FAD-dependent oxidoreductase [Desulfobacteraceae bacterium]